MKDLDPDQRASDYPPDDPSGTSLQLYSNLLGADQADAEWRDLDAFVHWLKTTFGLPPPATKESPFAEAGVDLAGCALEGDHVSEGRVELVNVASTSLRHCSTPDAHADVLAPALVK